MKETFSSQVSVKQCESSIGTTTPRVPVVQKQHLIRFCGCRIKVQINLTVVTSRVRRSAAHGHNHQEFESHDCRIVLSFGKALYDNFTGLVVGLRYRCTVPAQPVTSNRFELKICYAQSQRLSRDHRIK